MTFADHLVWLDTGRNPRHRGLRRGGSEAVIFMMLAREALASFKSGIYLRERELTHFGVEEWRDNWHQPPQEKTDRGSRPREIWRNKFGCVLFRGEIPCLYSVTLVKLPGFCGDVREGMYELLDEVDPAFLTLVDYVSQVTGAGVGIRLKSEPPATMCTAEVRTGRRVRYRFTPIPDQDFKSEQVGTSHAGAFWVERLEPSRGHGARFTGGGPGIDPLRFY